MSTFDEYDAAKARLTELTIGLAFSVQSYENDAVLRELLLDVSSVDTEGTGQPLGTIIIPTWSAERLHEIAAQEDAPIETVVAIASTLAVILNHPGSRDYVSELAMDHSLCPIHFCDWAICYDDNVESCAQIRAIFPHHHDV